MTDRLYRPIAQHDGPRPAGAHGVGGGPLWFTDVICLPRDGAAFRMPADKVPDQVLTRIVEPRADLVGASMTEPQIMGIINVTPDSFSDGGLNLAVDAAASSGLVMAEAGASLLDIGGESTRPGAVAVAAEEEIARIAPVIEAIRAQSDIAISVDTRKAAVAQAALEAGADLINDVSGFTFDPDLAPFCAKAGVPVCVMHSQGDPDIMQDNPQYASVTHDVYDMLDRQLTALETLGVPRSRILADPGIGFGKTVEHNLDLLRNIGVFHALGAPILLGVSRKGFIGRLSGETRAQARAPGSIAVGLAALAEGVQVLRVHDVAETAQALRMWNAVRDAGRETS